MKKNVILILFLFITITSVAQNGYRVEINQVFPKKASVYANAFNFKREMDNAISAQTAKLSGNSNYQILITTPSGKETQNIQNINWIQTINGVRSYHKKKTMPDDYYDVATIWEGYFCNIDGSCKGQVEKKEFVYRVAIVDNKDDFKTAFVDYYTADNVAANIVKDAPHEELCEAVIYIYDTDGQKEFRKESNLEQYNAYVSQKAIELEKENEIKSTQTIDCGQQELEDDTTIGGSIGSIVEQEQPAEIQKNSNNTFVTINGAYTNTENLSVGFTIGQVKKFGWFASVMSGFNYAGFGLNMPACDAEGYVGESFPFYKDEYAKTVFSAMGGGVMQLNDMIYVKVGLGLGNRSLSWKTIDDRWVRNGGYSAVGLDTSAGVMCIYKHFVVSLDGVVTTNFSNYIFEGRIGIGYSF